MRKGLLFVMMCVAFSASAQTKDGGISKKMLSEIEKENVMQASDRALVNAIAANAIEDLAKNRQNAGALDTHFSIETKKQSITDQKQSGRCWMFSGFNVLRSDFALRSDSNCSFICSSVIHG
jgi:bleomycin hydrolase